MANKNLSIVEIIEQIDQLTDEEHKALYDIAKILRSSGLSYRQKNKVLTYTDKALYIVMTYRRTP